MEDKIPVAVRRWRPDPCQSRQPHAVESSHRPEVTYPPSPCGFALNLLCDLEQVTSALCCVFLSNDMDITIMTSLAFHFSAKQEALLHMVKSLSREGKSFGLKESHLGFSIGSVTHCWMTWGQLVSLFVPRFPHLQNGNNNNSTYLPWRKNLRTVHMKLFPHSLAHADHGIKDVCTCHNPLWSSNERVITTMCKTLPNFVYKPITFNLRENPM